jgi:hypothetical protein
MGKRKRDKEGGVDEDTSSKPPVITRKWRRANAVDRDGMPAVIIRGTGETIPVENIYLKMRHSEATGIPLPKFEECWVCGGMDHLRRDCPKGARRDDGSLIQAPVECLQCRRRGHRLAECPERATLAGGGSGLRQGGLSAGAEGGGGSGGAAAADTGSSNPCYRCGEAHHLRDCPAPKRDGSLPFANCYVCHRTGHLASACPDNTKGVYPRGGCCKVCQSTAHLAKDCPVEAAQGGRAPAPPGPPHGGGGGGRARGRHAMHQQQQEEQEGEEAPRKAFEPGIFVGNTEDLGTGAFAQEPIKKVGGGSRRG